LNNNRATPRIFNGLGHRGSFFSRALVRKRHVSAVLGESQCDRGADASRPSGYQCTFPFQINHVFFLFYVVDPGRDGSYKMRKTLDRLSR
jgi:hypothetical protein